MRRYSSASSALVYGGSPQQYLPLLVHFVTMLCSCLVRDRDGGVSAETAGSGISLAVANWGQSGMCPEVLPQYVAIFKVGLKL